MMNLRHKYLEHDMSTLWYYSKVMPCVLNLPTVVGNFNFMAIIGGVFFLIG